MKRPAFLIASLGLNLLLAATVVWAIHRHQMIRPAADSAPSRSKKTSSGATPGTSPAAPVLTNEVTAPFHWSDVESTDYRAYLTNLHNLGCPEQRIRDIIIADVDALFAERARDYVAPLQGQFWEFASKPRDLEKVFKEHQKVLDALADEHEKLFVELFGTSNPRRDWRDAQRQQERNRTSDAQLDFLDEAKRTAVRALQDELNTALNDVRQMKFTGAREEVLKQRQAKEQEARKASEEKFRALLTPDEFAEYQLRNSSGAHVRSQLARMTLSEAEARSIAQTIATQTEAAEPLDPQDSAAKAVRDQLEQQKQDQIKQLLGDARYAEYQRASDGRYNETARIIERLQLPEQTAISVYQARLEAEKLAAQFRADRSTPAEERTAALAVLRTEAENSVRQLLGAKVFQDYQNHAGSWFEQLSRPPK